MHPNLHEIEKALKAGGHETLFLVSSVGPSEPAYVTNRILTNPRADLTYQIDELLGRFRPDLLIQRSFEGAFLEFWRKAVDAQIPRVVYNQDPIRIAWSEFLIRPMRIIRLARDLASHRLRLGPHVRITPVKFWGADSGLRLPKTHYFPMPMAWRGSVLRTPSSLLVAVVIAKHGQARKRVEWLLRFLKQDPKCFELYIIGSSPSRAESFRGRRFRRLNRKLRQIQQQGANVTVFNDLEKEDVEALLAQGDLFVLPSKREPYAISPLEAMSHGLPVLISSDGGAVSYVRRAGDEQIFRSRSYRSFRAHLQLLVEDPSLRATLSKANALQIAKEHSPQNFAANLAAIRLLAAEGSKPGKLTAARGRKTNL